MGRQQPEGNLENQMKAYDSHTEGRLNKIPSKTDEGDMKRTRRKVGGEGLTGPV